MLENLYFDLCLVKNTCVKLTELVHVFATTFSNTLTNLIVAHQKTYLIIDHVGF